MEKQIEIQEKYLYLPVWKETECSCLEIFLRKREEGAGEALEKIYELLIPQGGAGKLPPAYFAAIPVEDLMGETLILRGDFPDFFGDAITQGSNHSKPDRRMTDPVDEGAKDGRPHIHFTPDRGWINDPNGLVMKDGVYHLYFQYNPFDTRWNNMSWGHAVSKDLLHWEQKDTVLFPDGQGTMFSGCGLVNERGLLGLPKNALLYFYTAAGGANPWSEGKRFTQRIAYSLDGGMTLHKSERGVLPTICGENRDPKVFWHEESSAYVMVLWLEGNDFGIFRSIDLEEWEQTQALTLERAFECPDLIKLYDDRGGASWMFWCADGFYFWGEFDGYHFQTDGKRHEAYMSSLPYAAQSYSGVEGRCIQIPWLRLANRGEDYTGAMGLPRELSVHVTDKGEKQLRQRMTAEFELWKKAKQEWTFVDEGTGVASRWILAGEEGGRTVSFTSEEGACIWKAGDKQVLYRSDSGELKLGDQTYTIPSGIREFSFILDGNILEVSGNYDTIVGMYII